jgi:hypothetical protein
LALTVVVGMPSSRAAAAKLPASRTRTKTVISSMRIVHYAKFCTVNPASAG